MTTIDVSTDIPSGINTLERLATWAILSLRRVNPTAKILEVSEQSPVSVAQAAIVQADDGSIRFFLRASIPVAADFAEDNANKLWQKAEELSNTALPESFKTD